MNGSILLGIAHIGLGVLLGISGVVQDDTYFHLLGGVNMTLGALWIKDAER